MEGLLIQLHACIYRKNIKNLSFRASWPVTPSLSPSVNINLRYSGYFLPAMWWPDHGWCTTAPGVSELCSYKVNYFPDISKVIWYFVLVSNSLQSFWGQYQFYYRLSLWLDHTPPRLPPGWSLTLSSLQSPDFRNFRLLGQNQSISREKLGVSWYLISFSSFWLTKNEHYLRFHWWPVCQYSLQKETFSSRFI